MTSMRLKSRVLPAAGVVAAVATAVSGWAPVAQSAPSVGTKDAGVRAPAADPVDGTYESCGAYFGFGKNTDSVLDVVEFDVADQSGSDGVDHAVPDDTRVVLELTNTDDEVLECSPEQVSQADWDAAMDDIDINLPPGDSWPAWPGPGHYAYPSVSFEPFIEGFGRIVDVGFKVTGFPDGHTLVSPTGVVPLVQHFQTSRFNQTEYDVDPGVLDLIEAEAGAGPRAAFAEALPDCGDELPVEFTEDLVDAVNVLNAYRGNPAQTAEGVSCYDVGRLNAEVSVILGVIETTTYSEPIVLALPEVATTSTTSTTSTTVVPSTTPTTVPEAVAAGAVPGSPTYTG